MISIRGTRAVGATLVALAAIACSSSPEPMSSQPLAPNPTTPLPGATAGTAGPALPTAASGGPASGAAGSTPSASAGTTPPLATGGSGGPGLFPGAAGGVPIEGGPVTPAPVGVNEWRMMGYDLANTFNNTAETKLTKENAAMLTEAYTVDMGGNVYGAPLQIGDTIYASGSSNVRALEAATGKELWQLRGGATGSLSFADGRLYLHLLGGRIKAISTEGEELWALPGESRSTDGCSSPIVAGDLVLLGGSGGGAELTGGSFRGFVSAQNRMTGANVWTQYTVPENASGASIWSTVSVDLDAGRIYAGTGNNYGSPATDSSDAFIAFDLKTGEIVWKYQAVMNDTFTGLNFTPPDADFGSNVVLFDAMINETPTQLASAGNKAGDAFAVRRDTGAFVWKRTLCMGGKTGEQGIFVNASWTGKHMLYACNEGAASSPGTSTLFALDGATGDVAWMRKVDGRVWGRISIANGVGFMGVGTTLEVFDVDTGKSIKNFPSKGGTVAGTISIANGRVAWGEGMTWMRSNSAGSTLHVLTLP